MVAQYKESQVLQYSSTRKEGCGHHDNSYGMVVGGKLKLKLGQKS